MITIIEVVRRKPGLSVEQFQRYWRDMHAAKVCALPGVRRYVQSHTLLSGYAKRVPACDGVAELSFDNIEAVRELDATPELAAVKRDRDEFVDVGSRIEIVTEAVVIKDGAIPADGVKNIELVTRKADMAALDGVALTWFTDTGAMRDAARTEQYRRTRADEDNFLTVPLDFVITKEHVVIG